MAYAPQDEQWPSLQQVDSQIPQTTPRNRPRQKPACGAQGVRPARLLSHLPCNTWTSATGVRISPQGRGPASRHSFARNGEPSEDVLLSLCCFSIQNFSHESPFLNIHHVTSRTLPSAALHRRRHNSGLEGVCISLTLKSSRLEFKWQSGAQALPSELLRYGSSRKRKELPFTQSTKGARLSVKARTRSPLVAQEMSVGG